MFHRAGSADAGHLVLTHLYPDYDPALSLAWAR
jgi:ribonuclease BN (tRNA processing enzyme)